MEESFSLWNMLKHVTAYKTIADVLQRHNEYFAHIKILYITVPNLFQAHAYYNI